MNSKFNPDHYRYGAIEPWDFIVSQNMDFLTGNVVKYLTRAGHKDNESYLDDLLKAQAYLNKLIKNEVSTGSPRPSDQVQVADEPTDGELYTFDSQYTDLFDR